METLAPKFIKITKIGIMVEGGRAGYNERITIIIITIMVIDINSTAMACYDDAR